MARSLFPLAFRKSSPANRSSPESGSISRINIRASVVFPQPDSPTIASVSPASSRRLTPSTAVLRLSAPANPAPAAENVFLRLRASSSGSALSLLGIATSNFPPPHTTSASNTPISPPHSLADAFPPHHFPSFLPATLSSPHTPPSPEEPSSHSSTRQNPASFPPARSSRSSSPRFATSRKTLPQIAPSCAKHPAPARSVCAARDPIRRAPPCPQSQFFNALALRL